MLNIYSFFIIPSILPTISLGFEKVAVLETLGDELGKAFVNEDDLKVSVTNNFLFESSNMFWYSVGSNIQIIGIFWTNYGKPIFNLAIWFL